jgi:hypothetical protein
MLWIGRFEDEGKTAGIIAMGRTLSEMIDALPKRCRARIDARYRELKDDVESLRALRKVAGKAQTDIAAALKIKQPSEH